MLTKRLLSRHAQDTEALTAVRSEPDPFAVIPLLGSSDPIPGQRDLKTAEEDHPDWFALFDVHGGCCWSDVHTLRALLETAPSEFLRGLVQGSLVCRQGGDIARGEGSVEASWDEMQHITWCSRLHGLGGVRAPMLVLYRAISTAPTPFLRGMAVAFAQWSYARVH